MELETTQTETAAAFQVGREQFQPPTRFDGSKPLALVPQGTALVDIEAYLPAPDRKVTTVNVYDVDSLAAYIADQNENRTRIFASVSKRTVEAVIDYHDEAPSWCSHRAVLSCPFSDDWNDWNAKNKAALPQVTFAEFLEDHKWNVVDPDSATLMQIVQNLEANKSVVFRSGVNLQDGSFQLEYTESVEDQTKGKLKVPKQLALGIQPFKFGKPYEVLARLRYRIQDGKLTFTYLLDRPDRVLEDAFKKVVEEVATKTGIQPFLTA